jgi:hypothetical protein
MGDFQIVEVLAAVLTLLGGYFGIPRLADAFYLRRQENKILRALKALQLKLKQGQKNRDTFVKSGVFLNLKNLLWEAKEVLKNKEFLQEQLDQIINDLYSANQFDSIQDLRAKFENYFEFSPWSWANIAIANMSLYRWDNMPEYREYCLQASQQSIKRLPNYGTARAVILIVNMIDANRNKQIDHDGVKNLIIEINSGDDTLVSSETYNYLMSCQQISGWKKYIDLLFELYPSEMAIMKNRSLYK